MKIAILGVTSANHSLALNLLKYDSVEHIYMLGHCDNLVMPNKISVLCSKEYLSLAEYEEAFFTTLLGLEVDLIISCQLVFQLWSNLHLLLKRKGTPLLIPGDRVGHFEFSKIDCKKLLEYLEIPTPKSRSITYDQLFDEFFNIPRPFVLKYDKDIRFGLQTVIVTDENHLSEYDNLVKFGNQRVSDFFGPFENQQFLIEQYVSGKREYSYHVLCNQTNWEYFGSARDYKKMYDGDIGHNTTGMGSYSPVVDVDSKITIYVDKILNFFKNKNIPYIGFLYLGIMIDETGTPLVLEINTRPGNPELQTMLPLIKNDLSSLLYKTATNQLIPKVEFTDDFSVSINLVNKNYNLEEKNKVIPPKILSVPEDIMLSRPKDIIESQTYGVLTTTSTSIIEASNKIYNFLKDIDLGDFTYRKDIGQLP
jgi:phosphoribosylamine--glycine ligase